MEVPQDVWHCLESDAVANQQDPPRFPAVLNRTNTVCAPFPLLDVVVGILPDGPTFQTSEQCHTTAASQVSDDGWVSLRITM